MQKVFPGPWQRWGQGLEAEGFHTPLPLKVGRPHNKQPLFAESPHPRPIARARASVLGLQELNSVKTKRGLAGSLPQGLQVRTQTSLGAEPEGTCWEPSPGLSDENSAQPERRTRPRCAGRLTDRLCSLSGCCLRAPSLWRSVTQHQKLTHHPTGYFSGDVPPISFLWLP